ncbi:bone morphogenetic protein 7-like [Carcharodon carcharias]|uniref:bone morphogenetic protein 7-like n=1 Tax=Carcharodon carcharias TaxID=13397 RepID=UPI001B7EDAA5|nr:bone morphogenetic protein 7-like [Carcharodon carcharias]
MPARFICQWVALLSPLSMLSLRVPVGEERTEATQDRVVSEATQRLREVFGMGEFPRKTAPRRGPPQYMLDLFNAVADANGTTNTPRLLEGNVVRSFENKVHGEQTYFYFDVTSVGRDEQLLKAELRLFKLKERSQRAHHLCRVDLCELLDGSGIRASLISSKTVPLYTEGWEVFPVTRTVWKWVRNSSSNHGLMIITSIPAGNSLHLSPVRFAKSSGRQNNSHPFLVLFTDDRRRGTPENSRTTLLTGYNTMIKKKEPVVPTLPDENVILSSAQASRSRKIRAVPVLGTGRLLPCQKHPLYVDFEQIGWSTWIISPRGYSAYYCKGSCPFPLGQGFKATNHATVQSIVHALKLSKEVGTPCCVPDTLHSINLLYFDNEENVVLKQYDDMVAVSCGCH